MLIELAGECTRRLDNVQSFEFALTYPGLSCVGIEIGYSLARFVLRDPKVEKILSQVWRCPKNLSTISEIG